MYTVEKPEAGADLVTHSKDSKGQNQDSSLGDLMSGPILKITALGYDSNQQLLGSYYVTGILLTAFIHFKI